MKIDLSIYREEHGQNPKGYGEWEAIAITDSGAGTELTATGDWKEAKARLLAEAKTIGGVTRVVLQ